MSGKSVNCDGITVLIISFFVNLITFSRFEILIRTSKLFARRHDATGIRGTFVVSNSKKETNDEMIVANEESKPIGKCTKYCFIITLKNTSE